jgi:hypothetical protein
MMLFYVSVVTQGNRWQHPWTGHPFNVGNNINGINSDPSGNKNCEEFHPFTAPAITSLQYAYVRKVMDSLKRSRQRAFTKLAVMRLC